MPNCTQIDALVTPYIDGELAAGDRALVDGHARVCAPCHSRIAAERAVREAIRARKRDLRAPCASPALRAACAHAARLKAGGTSMDEARGSGPASVAGQATLRARFTPFALAASVVLVVGGAFLYEATDRSPRVLAAELAADHVKCFALNGVFGTQEAAAVVERTMSSSFGWRMRVSDQLSRAGLELVGARPCVYPEGKIAHIMYRHAGHPVSLFMLPNAARTEEVVEVFGHRAAIWCVGNRTFVLLAREPRRDVEQMASVVRASLR